MLPNPSWPLPWRWIHTDFVCLCSAGADLSQPLAGHTITSDDFSATLLSIKTPELSVIFIQDQVCSLGPFI